MEALHLAAGAARLRRTPSDPAMLASATAHMAKDWPGVVAAAKAVSAWELRGVPRLRDIPDAFWGAYADWLFAVPAYLYGLDAEAVAVHLTGCIDDLADWMVRNIAAIPVRAAADSYLRAMLPSLAQIPEARRMAYQIARAKLLERTLGGAVPAKLAPVSRIKRRLRVGFFHTAFEPSAETFATLARCTHLDTERVELHLIAFRAASGAVDEQCRQLAATVHVLPADFASRLMTLRGLQLDVLVVGDDLSGHAFPLAQIVQLRVAPLQVSVCPFTTGLGSVDLALLGRDDPASKHPEAFSERLALVPATAQAWDTSADRSAESTPWDRLSIGLDAHMVCVVTGVTAEPRLDFVERCGRVASLWPAARVVMIPAPGLRPHEAMRVAVDAQTGVRLHEPVPFDHAEFSSLLGLGDLAIELEGPAATLALEMGVPILTIEGSSTAALLRTAGLERLIFADVAARDAELGRLLRDADARGGLREEVARAMKVMPRFADTYAIAADMTALLERAWDELCASGARGFRRSRTPIQAEIVHSIAPADLQAEGRALLAAGRFERAAPCFLSAIQRDENDASLWFDLARSYQALGDPASAIASLEASLRLDEANGLGWLMLGEMAADAGMTDLAQDALAVAENLECDAERLAVLRSRTVV
jgi:hypothetical protein